MVQHAKVARGLSIGKPAGVPTGWRRRSGLLGPRGRHVQAGELSRYGAHPHPPHRRPLARERRAAHVADLGAVEAAGAVHGGAGGAVELPHEIVLPRLVRAH